jgi:hypothetical protein
MEKTGNPNREIDPLGEEIRLAVKLKATLEWMLQPDIRHEYFSEEIISPGSGYLLRWSRAALVPDHILV